MSIDPKLKKAKRDVVENIEALEEILGACIEDGMIDTDSSYYNELSELREDAHAVTTWEELTEIITLAKTIEVEIDAWGAIHGKNSLSLLWPHND